MRFIQICGGVEVGGITKFMNELNKSLKLCGHEASIYFCPSELKEKTKDNLIKGIIKYDYDDEEMFNTINSSDAVFVHSLIGAKKNPDLVEKFYGLLKRITTKKVFFMNSHSVLAYKFYGTKLFEDIDFLNLFDYFCTFSETNEISQKIIRCLGKEEYHKRYIQLFHPYVFSDSVKDNWTPFENKAPRVTYIGRYSSIKHPKQVQDLHKLAYKDFEFEMRGIDRAIGPASVPDLFYEIDTESKGLTFKERIKGPSKYTTYITNPWKKEHNVKLDDIMLDYPRGNRMFIFGTYEREDGMKAMSKSMFGIECYRLKKENYYGDNIEYAMFEIVEQGTIPIFDTFTGKSVYVHENGEKTNKTLYDLKLGLFLDPDFGNAEELVKEMNELKNNKDKYEEMRERCWKYYKNHCEPSHIINNLIQRINE